MVNKEMIDENYKIYKDYKSHENEKNQKIVSEVLDIFSDLKTYVKGKKIRNVMKALHVLLAQKLYDESRGMEKDIGDKSIKDFFIEFKQSTMDAYTEYKNLKEKNDEN